MVRKSTKTNTVKKKRTKGRRKKKAVKTAKPPAKQTDRNDKGQFIQGNKEGIKFPPGQSGNSAGPPIHRIHLWSWFCTYMSMTDAEIGKLDRNKLTLAQKSALGIAEDMRDRKCSSSQYLARHVWDREEGRPTEYLVIEEGDVLSDDECDEIRDLLKKYVK